MNATIPEETSTATCSWWQQFLSCRLFQRDRWPLLFVGVLLSMNLGRLHLTFQYMKIQVQTIELRIDNNNASTLVPNSDKNVAASSIPWASQQQHNNGSTLGLEKPNNVPRSIATVPIQFNASTLHPGISFSKETKSLSATQQIHTIIFNSSTLDPELLNHSSSMLEMATVKNNDIDIYTNITSMFQVPLSKWTNKSATVMQQQLLRVYVYDDLAAEFTTDIEKCLYEKFTTNLFHYQNFRADLGIINLFKTYPQRTWDPHEADVFVVPYPHAGHCICSPEWGGMHCSQVPQSDIDRLVDSLVYYNETTHRKHLFILSIERGLSNHKLSTQYFTLTLGPLERTATADAIVIPYLNDDPSFQPSVIRNRPSDWWTRPRNYSFAYICSSKNKRMRGAGGRKFRRFFENVIRSHGDGKLGGLPFLMNRPGMDTQSVAELYQNSIFCPTLPGDTSVQKRFFDVIMSGCLPVVLSWKTPLLPGGKSWFMPGPFQLKRRRTESFSIQESYPFVQRESLNLTNKDNDDGDFTIDYESFVVQIEMDETNQANMSNFWPTLESIMADPQELKRRQLAMMKYAPLFSYGMGRDAHVFEDAFSRILNHIRHLLK